MRLGARDSERGDTIIEVIFAVVVFSLVAVSCLSIMNKGIAIGERALEVTLVRQQMKAQAEALRYIHESRVAAPSSPEAVTWNKLLATYGQANASRFGDVVGACALPSGSGYKPFILNARKAEIWATAPSIDPTAGAGYPPYSQVVYNTDSSIKAAYGLWVEAVPSGAPVAAPFVDFHIRACWPSPGTSVPVTLGTIVRLYEPA